MKVAVDLLENLVNFKFIPTDYLLNKVFTFKNTKDQKDLNTYTALNDNSSQYFVKNSGNLLFILLGTYSFGWFFQFILSRLKRRFSCFNRLYNSLCKILYYSFVLRTLHVGYLKLCISSFVSLNQLTFSENGDTFSSLLCILTIIYDVVFPFFIYYLLRNKNNLKNEEFRAKNGTIYHNIDVEKDKATWFVHLFYLRRFVFALTICLLSEYVVFQIWIYSISSLLLMIYLVNVDPILNRK